MSAQFQAPGVGITSYRAVASGPSKQASQYVLETEEEKARPSLSRRGWKSLNHLILRGPRLGWWTLEILAAAVSMLGTAALIILLSQVNGLNQANWNFFITLNTLVAIISTAIRAAILIAVGGGLAQCAWNWYCPHLGSEAANGRPLEDFEVLSGATQQSWGSLRVLWMTRGVRLPSIGAAITILALGFDAFAQQVLDTEFRQTAFPSIHAKQYNGTAVPRTSLLTRNHDISFGPESGKYEITDAEIRAYYSAVHAGILGVDLGSPSPQCPTGNCTFPLTTSLGFCGHCFDYSDLVSMTTVNHTQIAFQVDITKKVNTSQQSNTRYDWDGLYIKREDNHDASEQFEHSVIYNWATMGGSSEIVNDALEAQSDRDLTLPFALFTAYGVPPNRMDSYKKELAKYQEDKTFDILDSMMAYECFINLCLQQYESKFDSGKYSEKVVATWENMTFHWKDERLSFKDVPESMNIGNLTEYDIMWTEVHDLGERFGGGDMSYSMMDEGPKEIVPVYTGDLTTKASLDDTITHVLNNQTNSFPSMNTFINNMALSMTNYLRNHVQSNSSSPYPGTVIYTEPFVVVKWAWVVYPGILLAGSWVFLAAVIVQTRRCGFMAWKEKHLPVLFAESSLEIRDAAVGGHVESEGYMDRVGDVRVVLNMGERGLEFTKVD